MSDVPDFIEKDYFDLNDRPCTLYHLVKTQPEWACNQIENYHSYKKGWIHKGGVKEEYILKAVADKQERFVRLDARRAWRETVKQLKDKLKIEKRECKRLSKYVIQVKEERNELEKDLNG